MYTYLYHIFRHSQISGWNGFRQNFTWIWHIIGHEGDSTAWTWHGTPRCHTFHLGDADERGHLGMGPRNTKGHLWNPFESSRNRMVIRCHKKCSTRIHSYRNHNLVFYVDCDDSLASHICKMLMFGSANIQRFFRHPDCSVGSTSSYTNWWHLRGGFQGGRPGGSADQGCDFGGGKHGLKMVEVGLKSEWVTCDTYFKISRIWEFGTFGPLILFVGAKRSVGVLQEIFGAHRNSLMCCWRRTGLCSDMFPEERSNPLSSSRIRPIHALFARGCPHRKTPGSIRHLPSGGALWCGTPKRGGPWWTRRKLGEKGEVKDFMHWFITASHAC